MYPFSVCMLEEFINYLSNQKRFSNHTVIAYKKDLEQFFEFIELDGFKIDEITHHQIRSYIVFLSEENNENTTINRKLSTLKTFFKFLKANQVIVVNPMSKIQGLKTPKTIPNFVPEKQLWDETLFNQFDDEFENKRDELILELLYQTGIRLSELIHLTEKNISNQSIKVLGKRNKERIIPISNSLLNKINQFIDLKQKLEINSEFLITNKNQKKIAPKFVYNKVNYYLGMVTNLKKKSPHVLRHSFATHMLNNGASIESIKKILGHTDLVATQVYTHSSFKQIKNIYEQSHPRGEN